MRIILLLPMFCIVFSGFVGGELKDKIARVPLTSLPFNKTKTTFCSLKSPFAFTPQEQKNLPFHIYNDLGLTKRDADTNTVCGICHRFNTNIAGIDLLAIDMTVSEYLKDLLATYKEGKLIDYVEARVSWSDWISMKQWRIDSSGVIIVTYLKLLDPSVVMEFSGFESIKAQRLDLFYIVEADGKFHQVKEVRYKPQNYTRAYLTDKTKDIWNGKEEVE